MKRIAAAGDTFRLSSLIACGSSVLLAVCGLTATSSIADAASLSFTVTGDVSAPRSFDLGALEALQQVTQTDMYLSSGRPVTDTFTGPTLQDVLNASGGITTNPMIKNDVLRHYAVVTGADGYKVVVSAGEIAPRFGHKQDLTAIMDINGQLPGSDGVARLTTPGDVRADAMSRKW